MGDVKGRYEKNKDGTFTWVGPSLEELRHWYERGKADGRAEALKEAEGGKPRSE